MEFKDLVKNSASDVVGIENLDDEARILNMQDCSFMGIGFRGLGSVNLFLDGNKVSGNETIDPNKVYNVFVCDGTCDIDTLTYYCVPGLIF